MFAVNITGNAELLLHLHHNRKPIKYPLTENCAYVIRDMTNPIEMHHSISIPENRQVLLFRFAAFTKKYISNNVQIFDKKKLSLFVEKINNFKRLPFVSCELSSKSEPKQPVVVDKLLNLINNRKPKNC